MLEKLFRIQIQKYKESENKWLKIDFEEQYKSHIDRIEISKELQSYAEIKLSSRIRKTFQDIFKLIQNIISHFQIQLTNEIPSFKNMLDEIYETKNYLEFEQFFMKLVEHMYTRAIENIQYSEYISYFNNFFLRLPVLISNMEEVFYENKKFLNLKKSRMFLIQNLKALNDKIPSIESDWTNTLITIENVIKIFNERNATKGRLGKESDNVVSNGKGNIKAGLNEKLHRVAYFEPDGRADTMKLPFITDIIKQEEHELNTVDPPLTEEQILVYEDQKTFNQGQLKFHDKFFRVLIGMTMEFNSRLTYYNKKQDFIANIGEFSNYDYFLDLTYKSFGKDEKKRFAMKFMDIIKKDLRKQEDQLFNQILDHGVGRKKKILSGRFDIDSQNYKEEDDKDIEIFLRRFFFQKKLFFNRLAWQYNDYLFEHILPVPDLFPPINFTPSILRIEAKYEGFKPLKKYFNESQTELPQIDEINQKSPSQKSSSQKQKKSALKAKDSNTKEGKSSSAKKNVRHTEPESPDKKKTDDPDQEIVINDPGNYAQIYKRRFKTGFYYNKSEYIGKDKKKIHSSWNDVHNLLLEMSSSLRFKAKLNPRFRKNQKNNEDIKAGLKDLEPEVLFKQLNALKKIEQIQVEKAQEKINLSYIGRERILKRQKDDNALFWGLTEGVQRQLATDLDDM